MKGDIVRFEIKTMEWCGILLTHMNIFLQPKIIKHPMYIGVPNMLFNETCTHVECTEKEAVLGYVHRIFVSKRKFYSGQN